MPHPPPPHQPVAQGGKSNPKLRVQAATPVPPSSGNPSVKHPSNAADNPQLPRIIPSTQPGGAQTAMNPPQMPPPGHIPSARSLHSSGSSMTDRFSRTIKPGGYCSCYWLKLTAESE